MQTVAENLDIRSLQANKVQWRVICGFHVVGQQDSENANLSLEGINDPECFCFVFSSLYYTYGFHASYEFLPTTHHLTVH